MSLRRILVGLDGSPLQNSVLAAALELAEAFQAKVVLFRAVSLPTEPLPEILNVTPDRVVEILTLAARESLSQVAERVPPARLGGVSVVLGAPWRAICDAAQKEDTDLIVIGSHGYGGVDRLLGTTAAKVVNHADRKVLVVRP